MNIREFQKMMRQLYFQKDSARGTTGTYNRLVDEVGELGEALKTTDKKFDTVILDPPYSLRKSYEKYKGHYIGSKWTQIRRAIVRVCNPKTRVISLGYNSQGMSRSLGFKKIAILLICHNGDHNDTIVTVEEKVQTNLIPLRPKGTEYP